MSRGPFEASCGQHSAWSNSCAKCGIVSLKEAWARSVLADAEKERQNGADGDLQLETPCQAERAELVSHISDLRLDDAVKSRDWENHMEAFLKDDRLGIWSSVKVR